MQLIYSDSILISCSQVMGSGQLEKITQGHKETFLGDDCSHYLDRADGFMSI